MKLLIIFPYLFNFQITAAKAFYSKTCVKQPLSKRPKIGFEKQLSLNAGQKYCRMLQGKHSAILSTCIKRLFCLFLSDRFTQVFLHLIGKLWRS